MNDLLITSLWLSFSGSIFILILYLSKPIVRHKLSKSWQYYIWLIVIARLLLPFSLEVYVWSSFVGNLESRMTLPTPKQEMSFEALPDNNYGNILLPPTSNDQPNNSTLTQVQNKSLVQQFGNGCSVLLTYAWLIWLMVALVLIIRKITIYQSFIRYIKAGRVEVSDIKDLELLGKVAEQLKIKRTVGLYTNNLISSPILIGFFNPCIILAANELADADLRNTILHELMHYKRLDMFYKWLVQLTICLHWFNPLVYLMGREINRACELSCDEAVIQRLDTNGQRAYGDTLLNALSAGGSYKNSLASVTLNESKELLKERLDMIMNYKKKSKLTIILSMLLAMIFFCGATFTGAYGAIGNSTSTAYDSYWSILFDLPHKQELGHVLTTSNLQFGNYELKADSNYTLTISWQDGGDALKVYLIGKNGYQSVFTLENGISEKISIPDDGRYYFISHYGRNGGTMKNVKYSFQKAETNNAISDTKLPAVINHTKIIYEDTAYRWPYIQHSITNNSSSNIVSIEIACLAFDKEGKPMELYWDARNVASNGEIGSVGFGSGGVDYGIVTGIKPYAPKSYDWLHVWNYQKILSGKTEIYESWPLFDGWWNQPDGVHVANYLISNIKKVTFEDGAIWENTEYYKWLKTYKGESISLQALQSYYPQK